tara:strand:+ start:3412 stop:3630 length:219 start_codon:yes stop_codon:yes gene_type:complete
MNKEGIIKYLEYYADDEELFFMTWNIDSILASEKVTKEEWKKVVQELDSFSLDETNYHVTDIIETVLKEIRK